MIALPPLLAGAVKTTIAEASRAVAEPIAGASGGVAGVTVLDAAEGLLVPIALVAVTLNV